MTTENQTVRPQEGSSNVGENKGNSRTDVIRLCAMAVIAGVSLFGLGKHVLWIDIIAVGAVLLGGYPVFRETFESLRHGHVNMEVSMAVAIFASLFLGQFRVSVVITFFVLLSEYIENYAIDRGRQTVVLLEKSQPKKALVRRNGSEYEVDTKTVQRNDVVIVRQGERIPVDGTIVVGSGFINQSAITGESARVEKFPGDRVFAGSVDESGVVEVRTEKVGNETVFGKIIQLVEEAENKKAPIQKVSDRLATWLVEFAIGFSLVTFLVTRNLTSTLSVVVVAGACGVAAGTPLAIVAIMGKAAKKGVIVKGGSYVEEMNRIDTVVIDKTGTLTFGEPKVTDIVGFRDSSEDVLKYAALAERHSNHPLARAILGKANDMGIDLSRSSGSSSSNYLPGRGIVSEVDGVEVLVGNNSLMTERHAQFPQGQEIQLMLDGVSNGMSTVFVARSGKVCGMIEISDEVRRESKMAVSELKRMGIRTIMLTGDGKTAAKKVAQQVGIEDYHASLLPGDKVTFVEELVRNGHKVAMVGDGMNDAPALARANVGIGMGAGTDVAIEEADVVLMTNELQKIADTVKLSKKAYRTIMTNFYGTVTVDGIGVTLAFLGFLNPLLAATIHVISELIFILNSARLIR